VTGATGALGPSVVHALDAAGYRVRTLALSAPAPGALPPTVELRSGDITERASVQAAMAGVAAVVHMAALLHIVNPPPALRGDYQRVNVEGTAHVVEAARQQGVARLVLFSTIAVYGKGRPTLVNEASPPAPDTFYGATKLAAEEIVLGAQRGDGQPLGVVLRLAAVYGAHVKGNYARLLHALARGRFVPIGAGTNRRTLVYEQDVAAAVLLALRQAAAPGRVYNVTDGQCHTMQTILAAMCAALGRRPPRGGVPVAPVRWAAGLVENSGRLLGRRPPIGRATIDKYSEEVCVDGTRLQTELGFAPQFDLTTGWRLTVEEMRRQGKL